MKKLYRLISTAGFLLLFTCCNSYKQTAYFQDLNYSGFSKEEIANYSLSTIQPEDQLRINVSSANPESSAMFNAPDGNTDGYLVDINGDIQFPVIGKLNVRGLNAIEISELIKKKLVVYVKDPRVTVTLSNFKVAVMGDVAQPGIYKAQNERLTLPEALTLAGDLNMSAMRQLVIVREKDGNREYIPVDLTSKEIFRSPYYYLRNNDLIYVRAGKAKYSKVDKGFQRISIILSIISVAAIFITR